MDIITLAPLAGKGELALARSDRGIHLRVKQLYTFHPIAPTEGVQPEAAGRVIPNAVSK
jgi:hypothetical protein